MIGALKKIKQALLTVSKNVYHYEAQKREGNYIVWAEDSGGENSWADDLCTYQAISGTIDYFTKTEYDPTVEAIQAALNDADIVWRFNSSQYETDTKYMHYEWEWEVSDGGEI